MQRFASTFKFAAGLASLALAQALFLPSVSAQTQQKIQFSDPNTPVAASNLNRLSVRDTTAKQAQEQMFKNIPAGRTLGPLDLNPDAPLPVQPRTRVDKKTLEMQERQRNWALNDGLDLEAKPLTLEEAAGIWQVGPDGRDKKSQTSIERYLERDTAKRSLDPVSLSEAMANDRKYDFSGTNGYGPVKFLPNGEIDLRQKLQGIADPLVPLATVPTGNSRPAVPTSFLPAGFATAPRDHQSEFQRMLDPNWTPPTVSPSGSLLGAADNFRGAGSVPANPFNLPASSPPSDHTILGVFPNLNAATSFRPHVLDDVNARALGLPDPSTVPPAYVPPVLPPAPIMPSSAFPKRRF